MVDLLRAFQAACPDNAGEYIHYGATTQDIQTPRSHWRCARMAAFAELGPALLSRFADRLGLAFPAVGWHVARDRVAEFVVTLAMVVASMART